MNYLGDRGPGDRGRFFVSLHVGESISINMNMSWNSRWIDEKDIVFDAIFY